jgi:shikimate kinase
MKIVLLGYMGSGKSTVSKQLAGALDIPFTDLDAYLESKEKASIREIFNDKGEIYFRKQESKYLQELLQDRKAGVLAVGGGTPCYGNNMDLIKKHSLSIYLKGSIPTIVQRLKKEKAKRPLIASLNEDQLTEFVAKHLFERRNFYEQAFRILSIDKRTVKELVLELQHIIQDELI